MAIPDYADLRAHKFFERYFVGETNGENNSCYKTGWDSTSGAKPTQYVTYNDGHSRACSYCGNRPFPIQSNIGDDISGYSCVCKAAMDEVEWQAKLHELELRHAKERHELCKTAPQPDPKVLVNIVTKVAKGITDDLSKGWGSTRLKALGVIPAVSLTNK